MNHPVIATSLLCALLSAWAGMPRHAAAGVVPTEQPKYIASRATSGITADGDLSDWPRDGALVLSYQHLPQDDLYARAALLWDAACLYVSCAVIDDRFCQPYSGADVWRGDSVQLGFDPLEKVDKPGHRPTDVQLVLALVDSGPMVWFYHGPQQGRVEAVKLAVRRDDQREEMIYEAAIPWAVLAPVHPDSMRTCGFTVSVNDNDGQPWAGFSYLDFSKDNAPGLWKGHAQWAGGLFPQWDIRQFGKLVFAGSSAGTGKPASLTAPAPGFPELQTSACTVTDVEVEARLLPEQQAASATVALAVTNQGTEPLLAPRLGFVINPDTRMESLVDQGGVELDREGPKSFTTEPGLMVVRLAVALPPGASQRLTFRYQTVFAGQVSNHVGPGNSWLLQECLWFPQLGEDPDDLEDLKRRNPGPFTLSITVPPGQRVVSDGQCLGERPDSAGTTWTWRSSARPFGFTAATYEEATRKMGGLAATAWTYPEHRTGAQAVLAAVAECARFYEDRLGPCPDTTFAVAEVDRRGGYGSLPLLLNRQNFEAEPSLPLIAHEVAHRWWGPLGPGFYGMHEALAEYCAASAAQSLRGRELPLDNWSGRFRGAARNALPLDTKQVDDQTYRAVAYGKGPYVVHMLRGVLGDETFWKALRALYTRGRSGPVPLSELQQICEQTSGKPLGWFFDQWLKQTSIPEYVLDRVKVQHRGEQFVTRARVRNEGRGWMPVDVVLTAGQERQAGRLTLAPGADTSLSFTTDQAPLGLEVDPERQILELRRYDNRHVLAGPQARRYTAKRLAEVGRVPRSGSDETAVRELISLYLQPGLDVGSAVDLWDCAAAVRYFGQPPEGAAEKDAMMREGQEVPGRLPDGCRQGEWTVAIAERAGQLVAEVRVAVEATMQGRDLSGRALYLLARDSARRWRLINFDMGF